MPSLRQADIHNVTCSLGTHLNADQFRQLCDGSRTVYLTFDVDANQSGSKPPSNWPIVLSRRVLPLAASSCQKDTIPTPSLFRAVTRTSFSLSWRPLCHELPRHPSENPIGRTQPVSSDRATVRRRVGWIKPLPWTASMSAASASTSLYSYAHSLLHFVRWWESVHHTGDIFKEDLADSTLLDYLRFQSSRQPPPSAATINDRVACADRASARVPRRNLPSRAGLPADLPAPPAAGIGRPRFELSRLRVKEPKLTIVPLSVDEVARFWASFHNARDLAIVGLMLMHGLRSAEVLALNPEDVLLSEVSSVCAARAASCASFLWRLRPRN